MALTVGYAATSTSLYAIGGTPPPTVVKSGYAAISWNESSKTFSVPAGLAAGTYAATLTATNSEGTATLTFTLTVSASTTQPTASMSNFTKGKTYARGMFSDVVETMWFGFDQQKVIANAYEYGLMNGYTDGTFKPLGNIRISEAITVAARVHKIYTTGNDDLTISGDPWYKVYIDYAIDNGIIRANDFGKDYERYATRGEMAYIFSRSLPPEELEAQNTVNSLPDVTSGTPYYEAILALYEAGVVEGSNGGVFNPSNNINRAEAAAIISRVILPGSRFKDKVYG
jgi:PKD repeat protein